VTLRSDLELEVRKIFADQWSKRDGTSVPEADDLRLANDAVLLDATVLYADLTGSTAMVDQRKPHLAAEVYKAFLHCAAKVVRAEGGTVTAYDGDRIMAVYIVGAKNTAAVRTALKINWAVRDIVNPTLKKQYPDLTLAVRHVVGVDTGNLWIARTGVRGANDLVWVGPAANYAAKLTELDAVYPTWITHRVYDSLLPEGKNGSDGRPMWELRNWTAMGGLRIYRSNSWWPIS
jgi:class 3 adenylate cyclase